MQNIQQLNQADQLRVAGLFLERAVHHRSASKNSLAAKKWKSSANEVGTAIFAFYKIAATVRKNAYIQRLKEASPCYFCTNFHESENGKGPTCTHLHNMEEDAISSRGELGVGCLDYARGPSYDETFVERELGNIEGFWSKEKVLVAIVDLADRLKTLAREELKEELKKEELL